MSHRLLIVDDEPDMRMLLILALGGSAYELVEAATGEEALALVGAQRFDLVILDLNLPGIDGLGVLEAWSASGVVPRLPVFMLTADAREGLEERALALGCRGYLTKPVPPQDLTEILARELGSGTSPATVGGS